MIFACTLIPIASFMVGFGVRHLFAEKLPLNQQLCALERERDEARKYATSLAYAHRTAARRGFQRGAEAMREAAANEVRSYSVTVTDPLGRKVALGADGLSVLADSIRALPTPEDKP